ncbi:geranylgeranyl diphosphate synthase, type II [Nonlabens sp. Hel1_33_55]|uniref:polyprenyl synthetase family protein n=1 Tax=Nonlabens sp. Hel1_33_55 TaxID=1336802 RepID=UPI000875B82E|nr:polyprenyl synthetase family protein [Nonlabens sp. Hel1_33_55]SCY38634.1 geranylgeranyl diphosphate synthase, type II [Nonlabens sp. Hel1_33_55]
MTSLENLRTQFLDYLQQSVAKTEPSGLYDPIHYILELGGKRLRPLLTLMSAEMYGATANKAMDAAVAIEVFHNFTLLHDDIMDAADLRRGKATVHKKWDVNTGILSGDAMMIMAYQRFLSYDKEAFYDLNQLFSKTALEVCEGQQYDVDFETRNDVTVEEYLLMIKLKTSVLVGCALQMGAIIAGKDKTEQEKIYKYGIELGMAFQLMDDYLDAFGDPETFGKEVGGDIRENKKTYLFLKSIEDEDVSRELKVLFTLDYNRLTSDQIADKKDRAKELFVNSGGANRTLEAIKDYTDKALATIQSLDISDENKSILKKFSEDLMSRIS